MRWVSKIIAVATLAGAASLSSATTVRYDVAQVSGATWQFDFTVTNDTLGAPLQGLDIYFNYATFSNLAAFDQPSNFQPFVQPPATDPNFLLADGIVSYLDPNAGIGAGHALGGFIIQADFSGAGTPGAPTWDVFDPSTFATLDPGGPAVPNSVRVPEPGTLAIFAFGILGIVLGRRRALQA